MEQHGNAGIGDFVLRFFFFFLNRFSTKLIT